MSEDEFWALLRFRMMATAKAPLGYCDWVEPGKYVLDGSLPRITGKIGFLNGPNVRECSFTLYLNHVPGSWEGLQWEALLPPDGTCGWFSFDPDRGEIEMRPPSPVSPPRMPPV